MKFKKNIFILSLLIISGCSYINENNIKESNNINVETFLEIQTNTGNIITYEDTEIQELEEELKKLIDILFEVSN